MSNKMNQKQSMCVSFKNEILITIWYIDIKMISDFYE